MAIQLRKSIGTERNSRGELIQHYADAIEIDGFLQPVSTSESDAAGYAERVTDRYRLLGFSVTIESKDIVLIDGEEYHVQGSSFDFSRWNPLSDFGGKTVELQRVVG